MAAKRKAKGGRPRKAGVPREANGRAVRAWAAAETAREAMATAIEARKRVYGLDDRAARDCRAGSLIGRLAIAGIINSEQYNAAQTFDNIRNAYQRAIMAKEDHPQPPPETSLDGSYEEFCDKAIERYETMLNYINDKMKAAMPPVSKYGFNMLVRDVYFPHYEHDLRRVLDIINGYLDLPRQKKTTA